MAGLASSTAAKEKQGGENKASDDDAGTKSTSGDGMAGQREAAGNAQMAGSSKVDRRGDARNSELEAGMGSSKGLATDSGGSAGKNGGQTTRASVDDTIPVQNALEAKLETEQATLQWLAQIPHDPVRFLRLRIAAEHKQRQDKGMAIQSKDSLWCLVAMARIILLAVPFCLAGTMAHAQDQPQFAGRIWVDVDQRNRLPFVQEMILLRLRGTYTRPVALVKTEQPALPGFRWMLIGKDEWSEAVENSPQVRGFEQVIAVFAQRSGNLVIPPFIQNLTFIDRGGARITTVIQSEPVTIQVAPELTDASSWWLAARSITAKEDWSHDPDGIDIGQSAKRSITISGVGVTDDQLPPRPEIKIPGLIVVPATPVRKTEIGLGKPLKQMDLKKTRPLQDCRGEGRSDFISDLFMDNPPGYWRPGNSAGYRNPLVQYGPKFYAAHRNFRTHRCTKGYRSNTCRHGTVAWDRRAIRQAWDGFHRSCFDCNCLCCRFDRDLTFVFAAISRANRENCPTLARL
ncbi:hypothetical protein [Phyllobacterium zundukense]|uniref:Uncharacterized protein n=1 Tax=Phyllobacterium zundukense TaxID=1867719 RepID=A0ACD4CXW5_9HYPH|nr:hypothetical protein [Phyllobacterium zundukense]UXN58430.1 hypothetical protein N8E88_10305 [Phyllobacterium zundukense]